MSLAPKQFFTLTALFSLSLTACGTMGQSKTVYPSNFVYETSLRAEQGWLGISAKDEAMAFIFNKGVVKDPKVALKSALPEAQINLRKWGLRYFSDDWYRYQVVLDADIKHGEDTIRCREVSTDGPVGAPTLKELTADGAVELQRSLQELVGACLLRSQL